MKTFFPENIRTVGVITPAGRLAPELMESGIAELRKAGIRVKGPESLPECRVSYLAGTPEDRAAQIMKMWLDPEVDLLLCSRGGFGCAQLLPHLNWKKLRARRIPLAGYSDITALHWAMASRNAGLPVVCPMLGKLSGLDEASCRDMKKVFSGEVRRCAVERISGGDFSGKVLAGNLTVAASLAGGDHFPDSDGRVVLLEDINEAAYRIDRSLTQLEQTGFFDRVSGVVFGSFTGSDPQELDELLRRFAARTGKPVVRKFPFGHNFPLMSFSFDDVLCVGDGTAELAPAVKC